MPCLSVCFYPVNVLCWNDQAQRNWAFATNSDLLITVSLEPNVAYLRYCNIKGFLHRVLKILWFKYLILFQRLNSFAVTELTWGKLIFLLNVLKIHQKKISHRYVWTCSWIFFCLFKAAISAKLLLLHFQNTICYPPLFPP